MSKRAQNRYKKDQEFYYVQFGGALTWQYYVFDCSKYELDEFLDQKIKSYEQKLNFVTTLTSEECLEHSHIVGKISKSEKERISEIYKDILLRVPHKQLDEAKQEIVKAEEIMIENGNLYATKPQSELLKWVVFYRELAVALSTMKRRSQKTPIITEYAHQHWQEFAKEIRAMYNPDYYISDFETTSHSFYVAEGYF